MLGIEHLLLFSGIAINAMVRPVPGWVSKDLRRRNFEKNQALLLQHRQQAHRGGAGSGGKARASCGRGGRRGDERIAAANGPTAPT
jgi:hypothetical protein